MSAEAAAEDRNDRAVAARRRAAVSAGAQVPAGAAVARLRMLDSDRPPVAERVAGAALAGPALAGAALAGPARLALPPALPDPRRVTLPARGNVPMGYARYTLPYLDQRDWGYVVLAGYRVAVPRALRADAARALLRRIAQYGPAAAGYVRLGDTLVPAILTPGDRMSLAYLSAGYPDAPLSE
jgi:hypothetical protein